MDEMAVSKFKATCLAALDRVRRTGRPLRVTRFGTLDHPDTERWLSPLSMWEALPLIERGRLDVDGPGDAWVREALERAPVIDAPVTREVAIASRALKSAHREPVDRFLAATATVFELTLVTADATLIGMKGVRVWPNRTPRRSGRSARSD